MLAYVFHLSHALALETDITNGEHLVKDEDLRFEMSGHGERQAYVHAAGVALDGRI